MREGSGLSLAPARRRGPGPSLLAGAALLLLGLASQPAHAHLMAAQQGTLNLVGEAGFLVLSVPVSAFRGVDEDADGALSRAELAAHDAAMRTQLLQGVQLLGPGGARPLQLIMVDLSPPDDAPQAAASQVVVLGRFALAAAPTGRGAAASHPPAPPGPLQLRFTLFGRAPQEQRQDFIITRQQERQALRLVPGQDTAEVLPSGWSAWLARARSAVAALFGESGALALVPVAGGLAGAWVWTSVRTRRRRKAAGCQPPPT